MAKIVLGLNDTSTFVGHFVSSPRKREKRDSRGDERQGLEERRTGMKGKKQKKLKKQNIPHLPLPATRIAGLTQL